MERKFDTLIASLLSMLLFSSLAGRCRAQVDDGGADTTMIVAISLPFAIFFAVTVGICIVFWACYYRVSQLAKQPHYHRRPRYVFNYPRRQQNVQPPQNRATSNGQSHTSTVYSNPPANSTQTGGDSPTTTTTAQSAVLGPPPSPGAPAQAHTGQDHHVSSSISSTSSGTTTQSSQIVPQATSEPDSLPEATLHQGDAPPAYEEAVGMKTVIVIDET